MLRLHFSTLAELREAAVEQEAVEAICTGQPARQTEKNNQKAQAKSNAAEASTSQAQSELTEEGTENSKSKSKAGTGKKKQKQQQQSNQSQGQQKQRGNSGGGGYQGRPKCSHCGRMGHTVDKCWTKDNSSGPRPSISSDTVKCCYRCGRPYHVAAICFADRHIDGRPLPQNGVKKPERYTDSSAATASKSNTATGSLGVCTTSHLNCRPGASLTPAVRPTNAWY